MAMTRMQWLVSLATLQLLLLGGCATLGPAYAPEASVPSDRATIYIYRESGVIGGGVSYMVNVNDLPLAALPSGGYFVYHAAPGELELSAKTEAKTSITLDAKAGEVYYVKGTIGIGVFVGHPHLVLVSKEVGAKDIATCKQVPGAPTDAEAARKNPTAAATDAGGTVVVVIDRSDLGLPAADPTPVPIDVTDARSKITLERTTLGRKMGAVVLTPNEREIVSAIVNSSARKALAAQPGLASASPVSCELREFSVTTPGTLAYWDATVHVEWLLKSGDQERKVSAAGRERTFLWPSAAVIQKAALQALKQALLDSDAAVAQLVATAKP